MLQYSAYNFYYQNSESYASRYQARHYEGYIPEDSLFARYQSYGALGDFPQDATRDDEAPHPSPWWTFLGWLLYFAGFGAMLFHGSLKGIWPVARHRILFKRLSSPCTCPKFEVAPWNAHYDRCISLHWRDNNLPFNMYAFITIPSCCQSFGVLGNQRLNSSTILVLEVQAHN